MGKYPLLESINYPDDLKKLSVEQLQQLAQELRQFIIEMISRTPGHFGASLGVVELTVALHYVFNTPYDRIVWDVGHQAYGHKILTGRRDRFHTLRQLNGISGFPSIFESEYDTFGVGHSSTSISAALGMAIAAKLKGEEDRQIVAVIGDGAMTAGLAFEGLNNAGASNANMLIILNDNNMAIDPSVGALSRYLVNFTTSRTYNKIRDEIWNLLSKGKKFGEEAIRMVQKLEGGLKTVLLQQSNFFESLNLRYFGPIDGHDLPLLIRTLEQLKSIKGPKLLHIKTQKGKGYKYAELDQPKWHSTSAPFDIETGKPMVEDNGPKPPKFQDVFGYTIIELAEKNDKIVGITPAMPSGSSLKYMMEKMPDRAFDVGIAEQHAVTFAAGLAKEGMIPFATIYSTFLQRAYDQVIHDVALQNLHVVFCIDRAGLVGGDGATHHGVYDLSYLRAIPNMVVSAPMDEVEMRNLMFTAQLEKNAFPFAIRYPRGRGVTIDWRQPMHEVEIGKGRRLKDGKDIAILSIGFIGQEAKKAIERLEKDGYSVAHYDMRFVKPLDEELLHEVFSNFDRVVTVEENAVMGGFGSAVLEFMAAHGYKNDVLVLGIPDIFIDHGKPEDLKRLAGIDADGIYSRTLDFLKNKRKKSSFVSKLFNHIL